MRPSTPPDPGGSSSRRTRRTLGPFTVGEVLGQGGMGSVYAGWDTRDGTPVALKVLRVGPVGNQRQRRRFARELQVLQRLDHPGLVRILGADAEAETPWLAMQRVEGENLQTRLERYGPLDEDEVLRLGESLCAALVAVHAAGVLHRDLKPDNVLVTKDGAYVLTDFGLAKDLEIEESRRLSLTGAIQGTPGYWAPEQARGEETSVATDVYGLGATLYAAATGRPPHQGASFVEVVAATVESRPLPPSALGARLSASLEAAILRALEKNPGKRFVSVEDFSRALETAAEPPPRGGRGRFVALGVAFALLAGAFAFAFAPPDAAPQASASVPPTPTPTPTPSADPSALRQRALAQATATPAVATERLRALLTQAAEAGDAEAARLLGLAFLRNHDALAFSPSTIDHDTAERWLRRSAVDGYPAGVAAYGLFLVTSRPERGEDGLALLREAAEREEPLALRGLGMVYAGRTQLPQRDLGRAFGYLERGVARGDAICAYALASLIVESRGVSRDLARVAELYLLAGRRGYPTAYHDLAVLYAQGESGMPRDMARAEELLELALSGGSENSAVNLAELLMRPERTSEEQARGLQLLIAASERGHAGAMHNLGVHYENQGLHRKALDWYERATEKDLQLSLANLILIYLEGRPGIERDVPHAIRLLERGDERNMPVVEFQYGAFCLEGIKGVTADPEKAARLFTEAAAKGHGPARLNLAIMRLRGVGIPRDPEAAEREARALLSHKDPEIRQRAGIVLRQIEELRAR